MKKDDRKKKIPLYRKICGVIILFAVAIFCFPEIKEKIYDLGFLSNERGS